LLGEETGILQLAGGVVVLFGVWLSNKQILFSQSN
jgi:drug/metabolite transporter (DMT)-like permease